MKRMNAGAASGGNDGGIFTMLKADGQKKLSEQLTGAAGCKLCLTAVLMIAAVVPAAGRAQDGLENRAPLRAQPYQVLPLGCVRAEGWLKHQLELQRDGLTGHAEELYADIGRSDWLTGEKKGGEYAWERGPYYTKGLLALAYVLDDPGLKAKARKWVEAVLKSQRPDGDFGPKNCNWWANMIVLMYLRDEYEVSKDPRVAAFLDRYFRFQLKTLPQHPLRADSMWAQARGGDNLDVVLWLYNVTGHKELLQLADLLIAQTGQWERYYADGSGQNAYPEHIVNVMQGLKTPPLMYLRSGAESHRDGYRNATRPDGWLMQKFGRVDAMLNGTEPLSDLSSTQGTELCAIVERILSCSIALRILGDASIGDQLETVAYNALPAALAPDIKGLRYYSLPNQPKCTDEALGFKNNGEEKHSICPGPDSGFGCCRSNFHFGWPKFVQSMWMATADHGLVAAAYGPNRVTAKVGAEGRTVSIDQDTGYPFQPTVVLTVATEREVAFPLKVRIPAWCQAPRAAVCGEVLAPPVPGTFLEIRRTWKNGDTVKLDFPMTPRVSHWINRSAAISRGPLVYALRIPEQPWTGIASFLDGRFHTYEIRPAGAWNYALLLKGSDRIVCEADVSATIPAQPFRAADAPVRLTVKAFRTDRSGWGAFRQDFPARAVEPPVSPLDTRGPIETVTLVPYGATQIRIALFPWTAE